MELTNARILGTDRPDPRPTLVTKRLLVRPFHPQDAPTVKRLAGAIEVAQMTSNIPHPYEPGIADEWIATHRDHFERGLELTLAIALRDAALSGQDTCIGAISLVRAPGHDRAEMGYWVGVPYWGCGYCTEAAWAIVGYGFEQMGLHRVCALHFAHNPASGRVMQKLGMTCEGILREHLKKGDRYIDLVTYGLLRSEWEVRR
jgi:ribosomal-protein-alanine N-acetyltransferase